MTDCVVVSTTVESQAAADVLAKALVLERLVACVQAIPIKSTYRWREKIEQASEILLQMKTQRTRVAALMQFVQDRHSYELPEWVVTTIEEASPAYLKWICDETSI